MLGALVAGRERHRTRLAPLREADARASSLRVVGEELVQVDTAVERAFGVVGRGQVHLVQIVEESVLAAGDYLDKHTDDGLLADVAL